MTAPSSISLPAKPRILVRGTNWLGDAVMTIPALMRLREKFPDAHIALLTPEKLRDLWPAAPGAGRLHPAIDELLCPRPQETVFGIAGRLRRGNFDAALALPNSPRSALEPFLARVPQRIGYARPWRNFFLTHPLPSRRGAVQMRKRPVAEIKRLMSSANGLESQNHPLSHQANDYLHLAAAFGANPAPLPPQLFVAEEELAAARTQFALDAVQAPVFGLNPGAEYGPAKRWPLENFIAAARLIQSQTHCRWILFGGNNDVALANVIESALGACAALNLAGRTTLRELMALLKLCRLLLTNDTGPMHVAAALSVPVIAIYGSTSPELTGPLSSGAAQKILNAGVPCSPCFLRECPIDFRCMTRIGVESVVQAVLECANVAH
ncbi:MAG: lipopolysaccharide heptosyltransferase II [Verrucomicrobia bacterium]|nr:lipopolysaccharide heptosyltransferase II [Verrucomicrobiota bacterium]MDE3098530.1 lipopolysaccharide heptosyltransferase II [Verrucomicrobiota bacterium]